MPDLSRIIKIEGTQHAVAQELVRSAATHFSLRKRNEDYWLKKIAGDLKKNTPFLGSEDEFVNFKAEWKGLAKLEDLSYQQGDMIGGGVAKLYAESAWSSNLKQDLLIMRFAYYNNEGVACGLEVACLKSNPGEWVIACLENAAAHPDKRTLHFYRCISHPSHNHKPKKIEDIKNSVKSNDLSSLIDNLLTTENNVPKIKVDLLEPLCQFRGQVSTYDALLHQYGETSGESIARASSLFLKKKVSQTRSTQGNNQSVKENSHHEQDRDSLGVSDTEGNDDPFRKDKEESLNESTQETSDHSDTDAPLPSSSSEILTAQGPDSSSLSQSQEINKVEDVNESATKAPDHSSNETQPAPSSPRVSTTKGAVPPSLIQLNSRKVLTDKQKEALFNLKNSLIHQIQINYTAWSCWKLSLFGHHHQARATHLIQLIKRAGTFDDLTYLIEKQLSLAEPKKYSQRERARLNTSESLSLMNDPYFDNAPKNPISKNGGFYRALKKCKDKLNDTITNKGSEFGLAEDEKQRYCIKA